MVETRVVESMHYEEIRDSMLDDISQIQNHSVDSDLEEDIESDWSQEMDELSSDVNDDGIHYYIQPVNEYENTEFTLYENYMESGGYEDPVSNRKTDERHRNVNEDGYEIPDNAQNLVMYNILSSSPEELVLTVDEDIMRI